MKKRLLSMLRQLPIWLLFVLPFAAFSQDKVVTGKVTDSKDGSPIAGISVQATGGAKKAGTSTGPDGSFKITLPAGTTKLVVTGTGFDKQEIDVAGKTDFSIAMVSANTNLDQVVVIGYQSVRKKDLTGTVGTVSSKNFNKGVAAAPDQLLQNKVAGVTIITNSGMPGGGTTVKIRGNNSIRGNSNPLYVVDGVPLDGGDARPGITLNAGGFGTTPNVNPLVYIDPNSIAQIDVLKDASAAAIYGSRGANGVIVVTTKHGQSGGPKIEVGTSFGFNIGYMKRFNILDASEFRSALTKYKLDTLTNKLDYGGNVDALKAITQKQLMQSYSLAMSGGNENGRYRASFYGTNGLGFLKSSSLGKYVGTFDGQYAMLDKKLNIAFNVIAAHTTEVAPLISNTAGSQGNLISSALQWNPTRSFTDASGNWIYPTNGSGNPMALLKAYSDNIGVTTILGNISASYKILPNLEYKFLYANNYSTGTRDINIYGFLGGVSGISGLGFGAKGYATLSSQTIDHTLTYNLDITKDLHMDALAGFEYWKDDYSNSTYSATGFNTNLSGNAPINVPYTASLQNGSTQNLPSTNVNPTYELQSLFGRVSFNYLSRYYLTGTIRHDGSSRFGANNKYGDFPSVAAKWVISNEKFMKTSPFSTLALRASYGITGSQDFVSGAAQEQYYFSAYNTFGQTNVANPNLRWEQSKTTNIGIDYAFLKGRISGTIDVYDKRTSNIIFQGSAIQPAPSAYYFLNLPGAILKNQGVEFAINGSIVQKTNFSWDLGFNVSYNKNKIQDLLDPNTKLPLQILTGAINGQGVSGSYGQIITNGYPVDEFYLKPFNGFTNGVQQIGANPTYAGDPNPHTTYGISTDLRYKKLSLSINGGGSGGYLILNNTAISVTNISGLGSGRNVDKNAINAGESISSGVGASTRFLEKGNFFKLRNVSLTYAVGNVGKYIKNLNAFVTANNLFVITKFSGFDPEVNVDKNNNGYPSLSIEYIPYPTPRTISFGFNLAL